MPGVDEDFARIRALGYVRTGSVGRAPDFELFGDPRSGLEIGIPITPQPYRVYDPDRARAMLFESQSLDEALGFINSQPEHPDSPRTFEPPQTMEELAEVVRRQIAESKASSAAQQEIWDQIQRGSGRSAKVASSALITELAEEDVRSARHKDSRWGLLIAVPAAVVAFLLLMWMMPGPLIFMSMFVMGAPPWVHGVLGAIAGVAWATALLSGPTWSSFARIGLAAAAGGLLCQLSGINEEYLGRWSALSGVIVAAGGAAASVDRPRWRPRIFAVGVLIGAASGFGLAYPRTEVSLRASLWLVLALLFGLLGAGISPSRR